MSSTGAGLWRRSWSWKSSGSPVGPVLAVMGRCWATRGKEVRMPGGGGGDQSQAGGRLQIIGFGEWREAEGDALRRTVAGPLPGGGL